MVQLTLSDGQSQILLSTLYARIEYVRSNVHYAGAKGIINELLTLIDTLENARKKSGF